MTLCLLDDIYVVTRPEGVGEVYRILEEVLRVFSCIRIHNGKRRFGTSPERVLRHATGWSGLHELRTPEPQCGREVGCPQTNKASRCWALHWGTTTLWPVTSKKSRETNKGF